MIRLLPFLAFLVFAPAWVLSAATRFDVVPLFTMSYAPPPIALADDGDIVFTDRLAFFGTDGGLFRAPLPLGSEAPERVAFEWTPVTALAWNRRALYATLDLRHPTGPSFAVVGQRLLIGGECPLDMAYLRTGTLNADGGREPA